MTRDDIIDELERMQREHEHDAEQKEIDQAKREALIYRYCAKCLQMLVIKIRKDNEALDTLIALAAKDVPYAYCCNGDPSTCDCVNPDHRTARENKP